MFLQLLLSTCCLYTAASGAKIRIALVAPSTTEGNASVAAAQLALQQNFTDTIELMTIRSNDSDPYQFSKDVATLIASSPVLVTGLIAVTASTPAANAVAAEAYYGSHAFVSVGAFNLNLNQGSASGLRITASAKNMGTAAAGLLQHFGFQQFSILASTDYSAAAKVLAHEMKKHQQFGLVASTASIDIFDTGQSTNSAAAQMKIILDQMKTRTARIVVLLCSKKDATFVLPLAHELNIMKKGWLWTGMGWLDQRFLIDVVSTKLLPKEALVGALSVVPSTTVDLAADASYLDSYTYDAMYALATAAVAASVANPQLDPSSDMSFCKLVEKQALTSQLRGLTGTISFAHGHDANDVANDGAGDPLNGLGSRENPSFAVYNVQQNGQSLQQIFLVSGDSGKVLGTAAHSIVWPGGIVSNTPPSDRAEIELGVQSWYIVISLSFIVAGYLLSNEGSRRGFPSVFQESLVIVTLGVVAGLFLRAGGDEELMATAIFDETVFTFILLPIIIFESAFTMQNKNIFFRNLGSILLLAVPGTLLAALFIGLCLLAASGNGILALSGPECFATGALLSAIDPVATIGVFGSLGVPKRLSTLLTGEAVVNDAVAIVLYRTMVSFMGEREPNTGAYIGAVFVTLLNLIGSCLMGMFVMVLCAFCLKALRLPNAVNNEHRQQHSSEIQVVLVLVFSYLSFALCEGLQLSGIVASLSGGLTASLYCAGNMSESGKTISKRIFKILANVSESLIFFNVGLNIALFLVTSQTQLKKVGVFLPLIAIVLCSVSRLLVLPPLVCCLNCRRVENRISFREQAVLWHAGLRGAIAWGKYFLLLLWVVIDC
jgi:NhaP-type Na+/H+ or K+/H+ antiporter